MMNAQTAIDRLNARAQARFAGTAVTARAMDSVSAPAVATDAAFSYFAVPLSKNMGRTPQGYLVCKDAVIGRTGKMQYLASSLQRGQLEDLGLSGKYSAQDVVDVWRDADEVFAPETLASFESMPITDDHPREFVNVKNHAMHSCGHVQNVRAGKTPLSTGDQAILADLVITDEDLADDVVARRKRQLSCGYNYRLAYDGQRLSQVGIQGNHVAVVAMGRAGREACINDSPGEGDEFYYARLNARARERFSQP